MADVVAPAIDRAPGRTVFYLDHATREKVLAKRGEVVLPDAEPVKKTAKKAAKKK